jgi:hypothetical protein
MRSLLFSFVLFPFLVHTPTADKIIHQYIDFTGGVKNWKQVKTIISKGDYDYGGIVFPFTTYSKAPDRYKFVVPSNGKFYAQGYDGKRGWKIDAFKNETKPTLLEGKPAMDMANEADIELESPFINYKAKGHSVKLEGTDTLENKLYYKLSLHKKSGQTETYYFDAVTHALYLKTSIAKNPELEGALIHTYFSEYKKVQGLNLPFKLVHKAGEQTILTITVKEVKLNTEIKEEEFRPMNW